ncbi:MAG TPA: hypothetical protein VN909_06910 [Candidatus Dormibacteraeota bacterium]|nr:hypothetical protein [Candidatus Dormibacteraeota bacterium]
MIDFIDTIAAASAGAVLLVLICTTPEKRGLKLAVASVLGAWIGLAVAVAASGKLADVAILGTLVTLPLVVTAALALASSAVRSALLGIPVPLVIGVNVFRLIGVMFLILASVGRLGGPFPFSAGWGDIITGALAIPVAILAARVPASDPRIIAWNVLGTLDLVVALFLGIVSANGSPLQLIHGGVGTAAMQTLPWSLTPTVLVPLFLVGHGIVFAHARAARATRGSQSRVY